MTQPKPTKLPLLRSESPTEFLAVRTRMYFEIQPQGAIEEHYVEDIVALVWDIKRQRGLRISTIQLAYGPALRKLLGHLVATSRSGLRQVPPEQDVNELAQGWLENDPAAKEEVADILGRVGLDESAIEAEAMKFCVDHLQRFDRSLAMASARLDKELRFVMDYRNSGFANRLRLKANQIAQEPAVINGGGAGQKTAA